MEPARSHPVRPRASIVIPVWNRADLTRTCLAALEATTRPTDFELIVVDNGSTDETSSLLAEQAAAGKLTVIANARNLGFAAACNQGAAAAAADAVVFLNNDTEPSDGWLDALLDAAEAPDVGIVGARLLYPDGTIQHAGIELVDGVPDHPFRFAAADLPDANCRRDLDMVTGACLLAKRSLFEEIGGFDTCYVNGVEDVDLCLKAREAGYRVVYEPAALLTHHEGQTPGRFDHVSQNLEKFFDRWRDRFDASGRFVSCVWRGDWGSVHSLAVVNEGVCNALAQRHVRVQRVERTGGSSRLDSVGVAAQWPVEFEAPSDGPFVLYQPWEFGEIPAAWAARIQQQVDEVWTPSEFSRASFLEAGVSPSLVHVVPNGVDLERFSPEGASYELEDRPATVFLFVGGMTYRKGIDLLLDAYGRAFTADDDVLLVIKGCGSNTYYRGQTAQESIASFVADPANPRLHAIDRELDFVELPSLYRAADCLVQPYRGEGFCLPALEALACGRPLIVTAGGPTDDFASDASAWRVPSVRVPLARGVLPEDLAPAGGGFLLEANLDALVEALQQAADPAERASKAARARADAERFSWPAAAAVVRQRLAALAGRTPIRTVAPAVVPGAKRVVVAVDAQWSDPATWAPAVDAYANAFGPSDETTLVLPAGDEGAAFASIMSYLEGAAIDTSDLADIVIADGSSLATGALELTADAFICPASSSPPPRARRVLAPDPVALRSLLTI